MPSLSLTVNINLPKGISLFFSALWLHQQLLYLREKHSTEMTVLLQIVYVFRDLAVTHFDETGSTVNEEALLLEQLRTPVIEVIEVVRYFEIHGHSQHFEHSVGVERISQSTWNCRISLDPS